MNRIYLDYNSTAPLNIHVYKNFIKALSNFGNPSSVHTEGRQAKAVIGEARQKISDLLHADKKNVIFTSGATEAAATLLTRYYFSGRIPLVMSHFYFSATEHPCITCLGRFPVEMSQVIPVDANGIVQPEKLKKILMRHDKSKGLPLVAIQYANHETGVIQPIMALAKVVREAGGLFIVDIVQAVFREKIDIRKGVGDFFILSAHKMGGPKGIGAFVASENTIRPQPLLPGGGQEYGLRSGTEAVPLILAFGVAATYASYTSEDQRRLAYFQRYLEQSLQDILPNLMIHGRDVSRLANTTFFSAPDFKAETMQIAFDLAGIAVSGGAACSSGKVGLSPVLRAMGYQKGAIRVSTGKETTMKEIEEFLTVFKKIISYDKT
ncbi:MAG: cysteine desulfurase [Candidatus Tokpelaia sp. JSC161]|nr:MAG: cysteine desulfurase [Candidatus Tokpelaia sp. JSC161]